MLNVKIEVNLHGPLSLQNIDMYTRVKCERRLGVKRNMYAQENDDKEQEETAGSGKVLP